VRVIEIDAPGFGRLRIEHLVLDYNGTIALDGALLPGVAERIGVLAKRTAVHALTADTFGTVASALSGLPCSVHVLPKGNEAEAKLAYVLGLGAQQAVCIGNGSNDRLMLAEAGLGVAVLGREGVAKAALAAADLLVPDIRDALDLLIYPLRLVATLRT
jgi:soluble P-type ATPase